MIRFPRSIRWRLQLWYGLLLVAVLCGFGLTAFQLESARQYRRIDDGLQKRISLLTAALRAAPGRGPERRGDPELKLNPQQAALFSDEDGHYYAVWMQGVAPVLRSPNAPKDVPRPRANEPVVRSRGAFREAYLFAAPVDCILVGRSVAAERRETGRLALVLTGLALLVLGGGLVGGWWLASRAIRPVAEISAAAEKIAGGNLAERIATNDTDSELGKLANVLNGTFARLEASFAQQARFTADAAHELRTPISVLLTQVQSVLARERPAEEYREALEACERAAQRLRTLSESLLELARLDQGYGSLRTAACDLAAIARETVETMRLLADQRQIRVSTGLQSAPARGDAVRLAQVVTNLVANALEYNQAGGEVRVTTGQDSGGVYLTVTNTGPGIARDDLGQIFERFYRGDKARTHGHTGLGLAITRSIVLAHAGSVEAASEPGKLTVFTVRLPGMDDAGRAEK